MRLTCPNCSAQYDVVEDMIPADGRDVQCSNCATTWFQEGRTRAVSGDARAEVRRPVGRAEPEHDFEIDLPELSEPADDSAAAPSRRPLADEKTLDILRQERAHEARKRAAERRGRMSDGAEPEDIAESAVDRADASRAAAAVQRARMATAASVARARTAEPDPIETSDDVSVDVPARSQVTEPEPAVSVSAPEENDDVADAIAMAMKDAATGAAAAGFADDLDDGVAVASGNRISRRDLLPDIEEINSSLRPDERAAENDGIEEDDEDESPPRKPGFAIGFGLILILVLLAVASYVFAADISARVPALAGPLSGYVAFIDAQRIALEASVNALTAKILPPE